MRVGEIQVGQAIGGQARSWLCRSRACDPADGAAQRRKRSGGLDGIQPLEIAGTRENDRRVGLLLARADKR